MGAPVWVVLAPVLALFEPGFYVRAARAPIARGLSYLAYLAALTALGAGLLLEWRWLPALDDLTGWVADRLPTITFTADGPLFAGAQPFVLEHPTYGRLLRVDTTSDLPDVDAPAFVAVTRKQIVLTRTDETVPAEHRAWDVVPQTDEARHGWSDVTVNGPGVREIYGTLRRLVWLFVPLVLVSTFAWKLVAALVYSVVALVMNAALGARLSYVALLSMTCFALTPATLLGWMSVVGLLGGTPVDWPLSLWVTTTYLYIAVRAASRAEPYEGVLA